MHVDVLVAIEVPDHAALATVDVDRVLAPRPEVRIRAAGHRSQRARIERGLGLAAECGRRRGGGLGGHVHPRAQVWRPAPRDGCCAAWNRDAGIVPQP